MLKSLDDIEGLVIGIDPGAHGAIAILGRDGCIHEIHDMPSVEVKIGKTKRARVSVYGLIDLLSGLNVEMVLIEQVGGMTGQSASASFTFGHSCGLIQGAVAALGLPLSLLPPQRWKKAACLPADKGAARVMAQQIWPLDAKLFARVKDDGRAEAALIARHYINTMSGARAA